MIARQFAGQDVAVGAKLSVTHAVGEGAIVYTRIAVAMLCTATVASAQNPERLPGRLVGQYTLVADRYNKTNVMPVDLELASIANLH